jgi:Tfp pilus tip-associated adhesin PilY1
MLDGTTLVGQQDGDPDCHLGDPYCSRPFFDGIGASIMKTTDKRNDYSSTTCLNPGWLQSTDHRTTATSQLLKSSTTVQQRTVQYLETKSQTVATTTQTTKTVSQLTKTTTQYAKQKTHMQVEKYKVKQSQEQTTMVREQFRLQTIRNFAQTIQPQLVTTTYHQHVEQWNTARSLSQETTTQYLQQTYQFNYGARQKLRHTYRIVELVGEDEHHVPLSGACPALSNCIVEEIFPAKPSHAGAPLGPGPDPTGTCTTSPGVDPTWVRTECSDGPAMVAYGPIASCTTTADSGSPNYIFYTCDKLPVAPSPAPTAINSTCVNGSKVMDGGTLVWTECSRPSATNKVVNVASCGIYPAPTGPNWITTTCAQPPGPDNQPPLPSAPCNEALGPQVGIGFVTTTCTKVVDTTTDTATCTNATGLSTPYNKITCTPQELSRVSVASAGCTGPTVVGTTTVSCEIKPSGPNPVAAAVGSCSAGPNGTPGTAGYYETACTNPSTDNFSDFVKPGNCVTFTATSAPWISTVCTEPVNDTSYSPPASCIADSGAGYPYLHTTCTTVETMAPVFVDPSTCPIGDTVGPAGGGYIVNHCFKVGVSVGNFLPGTCPTDIDPWVVVICSAGGFLEPVAFCNVGDTGVDGVDAWVCVAPGGINNRVTHPSACAQQTGDPGNSYVDVVCTGPAVTSGPAFVAPTACVPGWSGADADHMSKTDCTTLPIAPYAATTGVSSCTPGLDGGGIFTVCANPVATNYIAKPVSFCTEGGPSTDAFEVTTTCVKGDTLAFKASCVAKPPTTPLWQDITCGTAVPYDTSKPTDVCAVGTSSSVSPFETTTACDPVPLDPAADSASCTPSTGTGPQFIHTDCGWRSMTVNVSTGTCSPNVAGDASGVRTLCVASGGSGLKYSVATTTTVTTQRMSGSTPSGPPSIVPSTGPTVDVDGQCYTTPQTFTAQPPLDLVTFPTCTAWPCSVTTSVADGSTNSLADVAQYYYKTDLRPLMADNAGKAGTGIEDDNAPHQHMTTFVLGLGVSGTLDYKPDYRSMTTTSDFAKIRAGTLPWPLWPDPSVDYTNVDNWNNPKSIDDFWHTAVNGRGTYFSATDPTSVINGLGSALADVEGVVASGAADGVSTLEPVIGNNFAFSTSYKSGPWWGDLQGNLIDVNTGALTSKWSARGLLDSKVYANCDDRTIYLIRSGNSLVDFSWQSQKCPGGVNAGSPADTLDASEKLAFNAANINTLSQYAFMDAAQKAAIGGTDATNQYKLVNFVRGQRAYEGYLPGVVNKLFRSRLSVLGDIVDSQPVYVKAPFATYADAGYSSFKLTRSGRTPMVYVGANDGMLHAFNAIVDPLDPMSGQEAWAVIPSAVLGNLFKLADDNYQREAHQFYVDGTPVAGDVFVGGVWKTILVGGLNSGGKGYYALDVTDPTVPPQALWEFKQKNSPCNDTAGNTSDCNLGFSYGKPLITKLMVSGVDTWVVIFTSGYNNLNGVTGDGLGYLYVVNAGNGQLIYKIPTSAGSSTVPSGLAHINNYVDNVAINNETLRVYGGDLMGNLWRFELVATQSAQLIGTVTDASSNPQPITIRPELAELDGKPMVFIATGEFLGDSDVATSQRQSVYGVVDPLTSGPVYTDLRTALRHMPLVQTGTGVGATRASGACDAHCASTAGWVVDFPYPTVTAEKGERVVVEMKLVLGTLVVGSIVPNAVECGVGGHSWFNYFDFRTGSAVSSAPRTTASDPATALVGQYLADSLIVGFNVLTLPPPTGSSNRRFMTDFRMSDTSSINLPPPVADPIAQGRRISWREVVK